VIPEGEREREVKLVSRALCCRCKKEVVELLIYIGMDRWVGCTYIWNIPRLLNRFIIGKILDLHIIPLKEHYEGGFISILYADLG
jgi:hypothetical protein